MCKLICINPSLFLSATLKPRSERVPYKLGHSWAVLLPVKAKPRELAIGGKAYKT